MYAVLSSLFLIVVGIGLLVVARRGYRSGELRAGATGLGGAAYRPNREDNPLGFHIFLVLYCCSGVILLVWGVLMLFGAVPPLKLR
jgi:hypothetical protein